MKSSNPVTSQSDRPASRTRTAWLGLIPALLILCLAVAWKTESSPGYVENTAPQLEGSWSVAVTLDGQRLPIEALVSYSAGGAMVISDPNVFPMWPMTTTFHGTWAKKPGRTFVFTFITYQYDDTMNPPGVWKAVGKEKLTLEPGGDAYVGKGTIDWYDPNGQFAGTVQTETQGNRIPAE